MKYKYASSLLLCNIIFLSVYVGVEWAIAQWLIYIIMYVEYFNKCTFLTWDTPRSIISYIGNH